MDKNLVISWSVKFEYNGVIALAPKIIKQEVSPFPFLRNVILWLSGIAGKPMMQPTSTK